MTKRFAGLSTPRMGSRLLIALCLLPSLAFALTACGGGGSAPGGQGQGPASGTQPASQADQSPTARADQSPAALADQSPAALADQGTAVSGYVTVRGTGEPYPGVTVEFKDVYGGNVHTTTGADGYYSVQVPEGVYTALALDLNNENAGFDVVGRPDNTVSLPPSARIDFVAYPIT
jgi:hypothetical protein